MNARFLGRLYVALVNIYIVGVIGWVLCKSLFADRWGWLFLVNSFAIYLFLPLPIVLVTALIGRRWSVFIGSCTLLTLGIYLFGGLWFPARAAAVNGPHLRVMSYNVLGFNEHPEAVVAAIRASDADVVAFQELNLAVGSAIDQDLHKEYPYQVLDAADGVIGIGTISRYPLQVLDTTLPGAWVGRPQVLSMDFNGTSVTILHAHVISPNTASMQDLQWSIHERERQAQTLVDYVAAHPGPLIMPGDFNATDQSTAYRIVTTTLKDSWREAGRGLGHTFPGAASAGSSRISVAGMHVPQWLVRIDFIFHSAHWQAVDARIGPWDGYSDHRPVIADLVLAAP